jgi:N-acetylmuramoyl-L-alanine amidase
MKSVTRMHKKPLKSAGFRVLRAPDIPSVLVELGYISNRQDLQLLVSESWRNRTADSMAQAIETFLSSQTAGAARTWAN